MPPFSRLPRYLCLLAMTSTAIATIPPSSSYDGFHPLERTAYTRGEKVTFRFKAPPKQRITFSANGWLSQTLTSNALGLAQFELDTALLKPGDYHLQAHLEGASEPASLAFSVGPPYEPEQISIRRWGHVNTPEQMEWLQQRGFNGGTLSRVHTLVDSAPETRKTVRELLNHATRLGFEAGIYLHPLATRDTFLKETPSARVLFHGNHRMGGPTHPWPADPLSEACREYASEMARQAARAFGDYPGWRYAMLCSEHVTSPGINPEVLALAKADTGLAFENYLKGSTFRPISEESLNRAIIPDNDPDYIARKWFYERGNGTAILNLDIQEHLRKKRPDMSTSHEPWRTAPTRDTALGLNSIGSWTYAQKDLKRLLFGTYLRAPGRKEHQDVQAIITLFVYGYTVMPISDSTAQVSDDHPGKDPAFNADPDYTREALWIYLSQRPEEFSIYWGSAYMPENPKHDRFITSPESFDVIGEFAERVVRPFGPALLKTTPEKARVAVHLSAVTTWFTQRVPGWNKCEETLPYSLLLAMNHVPFEVLLDDDIAEGALKDFDVVVLPHPETFTETLYKELRTFQKRGGVVIAQQALRAELPGSQITSFDFSPLDRQDGRLSGKGEPFTTAEAARSLMEDYAKELRPLILPYQGEATAATPRVVTNTLTGGDIHYHFAINDDRTYGPRFGHHQLYFELGVRQQADLAFRRPPGTVFYDVLTRKPVSGEWKEERFHTKLWLGAADGKIIASLPEPLASPKIDVKAPLWKRGTSAEFTVTQTYASGKPVQGVVPVRVRLLEGSGLPSSYDRYTAVTNGTLTLDYLPAINEAPGKWAIVVEELISGQEIRKEIACE